LKIALVAFAVADIVSNASPRKPNIVILYADDWGWAISRVMVIRGYGKISRKEFVGSNAKQCQPRRI